MNDNGWTAVLRRTARLDRPTLQLFLLLLGVGLAARLHGALAGGHSMDYYNLVFNENPERLIAMGRFCTWAVLKFCTLFGFQPPDIPVLSALIFIVGWSWTALLLVRWWSEGRGVPRAVALVAGALLVLHPYMSEHLYFQDAVLFPAFAFALMALALNLARWRWNDMALAVLLMVLALGFYQIALNFAAVAIAIAGVMTLLFPTEAEAGLHPLARLRRSRAAAGAFMLAIALPVYTLLRALVIAGFGLTPDYRGELLRAENIDRRLYELSYLWPRLLGDPVLPAALQWFLIVLAVCLLACGIIAVLRGDRRGQDALALVLAWGLLVAGLAASVATVALLNVWWPAPRSLSGLAVLSGGLALAALLAARQRLRRILLGLTVAVAIGLIGFNGRIFFDQQRVFVRDAALAARVMHRIESLPGVHVARSIAIHGLYMTPPDKLPSVFLDLNVSAFGPPWSRQAFLREITGYRFMAPDDAAQARAGDYCASNGAWPAPNAVALLDTLIVVCLPDLRDEW
jgi:hypothetical protein